MSDSLADALSKVGLITEQEKIGVLADQAHSFAEREALWRKAASKGNREHIILVQNCSLIRDFRDSAKKILCECPELAIDVVKAAHRFEKQQGGDKLIWLCYQVCDLISQVPAQKRERFLERAFGRAGSFIEIPD